MKQTYEAIEWELVLFDGKDVVTSSDEQTVGVNFDGEE